VAEASGGEGAIRQWEERARCGAAAAQSAANCSVYPEPSTGTGARSPAGRLLVKRYDVFVRLGGVVFK